MEDNYTNELTEVNSVRIRQPNEVSNETTVQLVENFANFVIGLSQQIADNNEAKYKAQANVMIANIYAKMQEELQDINGYYNIREKQAEQFNEITTHYQDRLKSLTDQYNSEENETKAERIKWSIEKLESGVGELLNQLAKNITSEQNKRLEISKSKNKRTFGFFRKR